MKALVGRRDARLRALVNAIPYISFLGVKFDRHGDELTALMSFDEKLVGNMMLPALHGGAVAGLLEVTAIVELSWALISDGLDTHSLEQNEHIDDAVPSIPKTIDFSVDYLRSCHPSDAYARAKVVRKGRRYASVHVWGWQDQYSKPFAAASGHFLVPKRNEEPDL